MTTELDQGGPHLDRSHLDRKSLVTTVYLPSAVFGIGGAVDLLCSYPAGQLRDRFGRRVVAVPSLVVLAAAFLCLPAADDLASLTVGGLALLGAACMFRWIPRYSPWPRRAPQTAVPAGPPTDPVPSTRGPTCVSDCSFPKAGDWTSSASTPPTSGG